MSTLAVRFNRQATKGGIGQHPLMEGGNGDRGLPHKG